MTHARSTNFGLETAETHGRWQLFCPYKGTETSSMFGKSPFLRFEEPCAIAICHVPSHEAKPAMKRTNQNENAAPFPSRQTKPNAERTNGEAHNLDCICMPFCER